MPCEKYSGWMTDAALGELRAEREPELLAHAMECEACREELAHAKKVREFVERGVEELVVGEPSAQFDTRLRRRIAQESRALGFDWAAWVPLAAGAVALAVFLILVIGRTPHRGAVGPGVASDASTAKTISPSVPSSVAPAEPVKNALSAREAGGERATERATERGPHSPSANAGLPKIIVPPGQLFAAARLSEAIRSGRVDGRQLLAAQQDDEKPLEVKPIEIAPLESLASQDDAEKPADPIQF
jgi:anti-sigma factor RsiW